MADGRAFHKLIARYYEFESEYTSERVLTKANGRGGRSDLFMWLESDHSDAVIIESKWTNWDRLHRRGNLNRNLGSHRRQVLSYIDGEIWTEKSATGELVELESINRQAGLMYPITPSSNELRQLIEDSLGEWGISTLWFDDPPPSSTPGGSAWAALQSGQIETDDLHGSVTWKTYLKQILEI